MTSWQLDPAHSQVGFSVKHMMVTRVRGRFARFAIDLEFDETNPADASVVARLDASSIDTGLDARDQHLRSADFLDTERFPEIVFRSTGVEATGDQVRIAGDLTIKGVTRPVVLDAELNGIVPDMRGGHRAAFAATTRFSRKDWGLTWNVGLESGGWLVGDEIRLDIEAAFVAREEAGRVAA